MNTIKKLIGELEVTTISGLPTKSVAITAFVKAGFRHDPPGKEGLAHFSEHMLFNGTKNYPSHKIEAEMLEKFGGKHTAFTWIDEQYHTVKLPQEQLSLAVSIILESLFLPLINEANIEREKNIVLEEIKRSNSNPSYAFWNKVWLDLFFQDTPLARPYYGTEEKNLKFKQPDVHDFLNTFFLPSNTSLFISGNELGETWSLVEKELQNIKQTKGMASIPEVAPVQKKRLYQDSNYDSEVVGVGVGVPTIPMKNVENRIVLDIIKDMIGGYFGTNLVSSLKEKGGLIYTWNMYHENLTDSGYIMFQTTCSSKNAEIVTLEILNEFERLATGNFREEEAQIAKGHLKGNVMMTIERPEDFNMWYGIQKARGLDIPLSVDEYVKKVDLVSLEDLKKVASKYFQRKNVLAGILGKADLPKVEELLR